MKTKDEKSLTDYFEIRNIKWLYEILIDLENNFIRTGVLRQTKGEYTVAELIAFVEKQNGMPDIISITFEAVPSGTKYVLGCDCYHGGGSFKRADFEPEKR